MIGKHITHADPPNWTISGTFFVVVVVGRGREALCRRSAGG